MKILVGLSGGIDSAIVAYLLKKQGHEVIGAMMSIWDKSFVEPKNKRYSTCFGPEENEILNLHKIGKFLKIPLHILNCKEEYKKIVIENFKNEYKNGRTPNPCIWCNTYIKFGTLLAKAKKQGISFDKFATGHYANIKFSNSLNAYQLLKAIDKKKDQTYFLYRLTQNTLSKTVFPLGRYTKKQVKDIAKDIGLPIINQRDSQDFYADDYNNILKFSSNPGNIIDKTGKILGKHKGIWNYTIGKRKKLGLSGGTAKPLYVINIMTKQNAIVVGTKEDLYSSYLIADKVIWASFCTIHKQSIIKANIKIRQQHKCAMATITPLNNTEVKIKFDEPQMSITAGQSVVFYDDNVVLGGGIIKK
ncbi:MAG: tRNA 2-thiouridine(34) synthase MnmA [Endomicrobium sp.]|nr:tRNA 2-thiouridine(34) synthase MnmA [Endomicrobium sp.]